MDIQKIKYFRLVVDAGGVRGAAGLVGLSPGALSKAMKGLETELGYPLLSVSGRKMNVTEQGQLLYEQSRSLVGEYEKFVSKVKNLEAGQSTLRVSSYGGYISYCLAEATRGLKNTSLSAVFRLPGEIEKSILADQADVGLTHMAFPDPQLEHIRLANFHMLLVQKPGVFDHLSIEQVPLVVPHPSPGGDAFHFQNFEGWPTQDYKRNVRYTTESVEFALDVCRRGLAALFAPRYILNLHNRIVKDEFNLVARALPESFSPVCHELYFVKRKSTSTSGCIQVFMEEIKRVCQ